MANPVTPDKFDAVLFDLDGVLTATAKVHAVCWKRMFDEFLQRRAEATSEPFVPFDIETDYREFVDGKRRYDGVRSFLQSREISLPDGESSDPPNADSVCGLGNRKNALINEVIETEGVEVFQGSVRFVKHLLDLGIRTAVVSSSANCLAVMMAAEIDHLFEVRIDGAVATERGLPGKPAPDTFLAAAKDLGVEPARAVVVEDAISGVQAGQAGAFGLVIGVDRIGKPDALSSNGADLVVSDLGDLLG